MVRVNIMESMSTPLVSITSYLNLKLSRDLLNQLNNTIINGPPFMFLIVALDLFIKSMGCFESPHLFPTLLLILYILFNHHVPVLVALHMRVILAILNPH
jgi:hypothetical protein